MNEPNNLSFEDSGKVLGPTDGMEGFPCEEWINASCTISYEIIPFEKTIDNVSRIIKDISPISSQDSENKRL